MRLKPSPRSCCTAPPSWSAATSRPRPAVSSFEASAARCRVVARTRSVPPSQPPSRMTPPRWRRATRASRLVRLAPLSRPTMSSCPARSSSSMPATIAGAHEEGVDGVLVVAAGVVVVDGVALVGGTVVGALDVDTGVDDACALLLAALHPALDLRAVSCVGGNAPVDDVVRNTLLVLETAGRSDVPVARGAERPLLETPVDARHVHGDDGMGDLGWPAAATTVDPRHAVELLRDVCREAAAEG